MSNLIPIDASRARNNFFKILDKVFLEDEAFLINKAGIPVAKIIKAEISKRKSIMNFAGIWKEIETRKITDYIYKGRSDKRKARRKLAKIN